MSSQLGIGVPVPKMLPITGTWTLPFAAYMTVLAQRVAFTRLESKKWMGGGGGEDSTESKELEVNVRSHQNFLENVPLAFVLTAIAELNGANRRILHYSLAAFFVARLLHVELGLRREGSMGNGRTFGFWGSQAFLVGMAGYATWLVKAYWGF